ncbi:MAG TPA: NAD(+)/NADH kinase, partial [Solirubrobacteraceae bacterium]
MSPRPIGVVIHPRRDSRALIGCILDWAARHGKQVRGMEEARDLLPEAVTPVPPDELAAGCRMVIALGGDGTILRALKLAHPYGVPVLGVNLGRLAFLAEVSLDDLPASLEAIDRDQYWLEERATMHIQHVDCGAREVLPTTVFNDSAITRQPGRGPAALAVEVEGQVFGRYTTDALVIATPTGSTAYSFAAGGPIVSPRHRGLLVTPVAPHAAFDRAVFLHPD